MRSEEGEVKLEVYYSDAEKPGDGYGWKLYAFSHEYTDYLDPEDVLEPRDDLGRLNPEFLGWRRRLACGTAFLASRYKHSGEAWFRCGTSKPGVEFRWDGTRVAGIMVWQGEARDLPKTFEERQASVDAAFDAYTAWLNGEVYGFHLEVWKDVADEGPTYEDSCGGFIGTDHFEECLKEALAAAKVEKVTTCSGDAVDLVQYFDIEVEAEA